MAVGKDCMRVDLMAMAQVERMAVDSEMAMAERWVDWMVDD